MKLLPLFAVLLLVGCTSPLGKLERIWPDGASVEIDDFNLTVSMSGSGSVTAKRISWTGTNGFPVPAGKTNVVTTITATK